MKKFLTLAISGLLFLACDFASDAVKYKPDIEVVWVDPVASPVGGDDVEISEIQITAKNSIDCTITTMIWEYYAGDTRFFGPFEIPMHLKVPGIVSSGEGDTVSILNVPLPTDTVFNYLIGTNQYEAGAFISVVAVDDYEGDQSDTASFWFGLYREP